MLTVFPVVEDLQFTFLRSKQRLSQLRNGVGCGVRPSEEIAAARPLHNFYPRVAKHLTEAIIAVNNSIILHLGIGNNKLAV